MSGAKTQDFFRCLLGLYQQNHGLIGPRARLLDQGLGTVQQAMCLRCVLRAAPRQARPSRDKARVALGQAIRLPPRHPNRLGGDLAGAPWIARAHEIVGLECRYSGLVLQACPAAAGCVERLLEEAVGLYEVSCCRGRQTLTVTR